LWDENSSADPAADLLFQYHVVGEEGLRTGAIDVVAGMVQATTVPEPSTSVIVLLGIAATAIVSRRPRLGSVAAIAFGVSLLTTSIASADVTLDRNYLMGEGDGDGGAPGVYV